MVSSQGWADKWDWEPTWAPEGQGGVVTEYFMVLGPLAGPSNGHLLPFLVLPTHASNNFISWPVLEQHLASMFLL